MEGLVGPSATFWHGKRVLLTGHTGFKGSWLALWLELLGADLRGFSLAPTEPDGTTALWTLLDGPGGATFGDICDRAAVRRAIDEFDPEIVLHLAAQALVHLSYDEPVETFATNVLGLAHVLDAARSGRSLRAVVNVTSDKCYENVEQIWPYRETERMGGSDPYSASKGCAELVTTSYQRSFYKLPTGPQLASARAGNVIGGGDRAADRLVPDAVRAFTAASPLMIRNPLATRPWQHVLEPLSGYLVLAERLFEHGASFAEGWNFGPADDQAWPVARVADRLVEAWRDGASWRQDPASYPKEAQLLRVDSNKARTRLSWRARLSVDEALDWTVRWYQAVRDGEDPRAFTVEQIKQYEKAVS